MNTQNLPDKAGVIMFPPLLYVLVLLAGIAISLIFPNHFINFSIALPLGSLLFLSGLFTMLRAGRTFIKNKNPINPSGSTQLIIKSGIYKYTRNPMYVSFSIMYVGISLLTNAWCSFLLLFPLLVLVQKGLIEREERYLTRKFGGEYVDYKTKVRRWI